MSKASLKSLRRVEWNLDFLLRFSSMENEEEGRLKVGPSKLVEILIASVRNFTANNLDKAWNSIINRNHFHKYS
ncbi:hypothetical protein [Flammeovirga sp. SJP92]|uniref:hypothetical protein n=1 Tax=Flammeovirga sp. SJP92 TaxID=1775430 RepID=UPI00155FC428|nr:hypothetical protein [Flammeovirga sp. SJP92]